MKHLFLTLLICLALTVVMSVWAKDPDLVIYYSFDKFGNIVSDESGHGNDGVINGSITPDPGGKRGGAAKFAKGSFIDLNGPKIAAANIPVDAMTLCTWAKLENTGDQHAIFNARATDQTWVVHPEFRSDGKVRWLLRAAGGVTIFNIQDGSWTPGQWVHFGGVYSAADAKAILYLNGQKVTEAVGGAKIVSDWGMGARVGYNIDNARPFTGLMDDFIIYKRALSQDEINAVMLGGPPEAASVSPKDNLTSTWGGIKTAR